MLPYSREVLFSLFHYLNQSFAWAQWPALAVALLSIPAAFLGPPNIRRLALAGPALLWAATAGLWYVHILGQIDFLAPKYAVVAGLTALGFATLALVTGPLDDRPRGHLISLILPAAALLWPLADLTTGPGGWSIRLPGLHPAPLLLLSLGILWRVRPRGAAWLLIPALLVAAPIAYRAYVHELPQDWLPLASVAVTLVGLLFGMRRSG